MSPRAAVRISYVVVCLGLANFNVKEHIAAVFCFVQLFESAVVVQKQP